MALSTLLTVRSNRMTIAVMALWLVYVVAAHPYAESAGGMFYRKHWYELPFFLFVAFGQRVAGTVGLLPTDSGTIQIMSGLCALAVCVKSAFWVKEASVNR